MQRMPQGKPRLIFASHLDALALQHMLLHQGVLEQLVAEHYGLALAMFELNDALADVVRQVQARGVYLVARLMLPLDEGVWLNLQNYPQAIERYQRLQSWAQTNELSFDAIGLQIEPPASELANIQQWGLHDVARRLWLARENILYPAAHAAYTDLINQMHRDGYEVHTYQLPVIADDHRAGTTLVQRALDIADLPSDLEVLMCYSSLTVESLGVDIGSALINSYGPSADSIAVGNTEASTTPGNQPPDRTPPALLWEVLQRDLLLAANHTDTIYVFSLEGCVERQLLPAIAAIDWSSEPTLPVPRRMLVSTLRGMLLVVLLVARFSRSIFSWLGWLLALLLLLRQWRQRRPDTHQQPDEQNKL
ncbi:MAG: hypothetical protein HC828_16065 [Blastochloris sp.]|nr:hypothetical protein [Blastochloris sp.]